MLSKTFIMKWLVLFVSLLACASPTTAFWRLLCHGVLGVGRIDPIRSFGNVSQHAHALFGAGNLGIDSTLADLMASNCTSCSVTQDKSAYWAPAMYFNHTNGTIELVPNQGGLTAYYFNDVGCDGRLPVAFPPGFRMISGNGVLRDFPYPVPDKPMGLWDAKDKSNAALNAKGIGFNCLSSNIKAVEGAMAFHYLRNKTYLDAHCNDGVRAELMFPSCWNGVDLDSLDHQSHILFSEGIRGGACPSGFPNKTATLFYEIIWLTQTFVNVDGQFAMANGDPTGYGYHGDFIAGWNQNLLQAALNTCTSKTGLQEDCPLFNIQDDQDCGACKMSLPAALENEDTTGPMTTLPGSMLIVAGPAPATANFPPYGAVTRPATMASPSITVPPSPPSNGLSSTTTTYTSTETFTTDGAEVHLVVVEQSVIVYTTKTLLVAAAPSKRHVHGHGHGHGHF